MPHDAIDPVPVRGGSGAWPCNRSRAAHACHDPIVLSITSIHARHDPQCVARCGGACSVPAQLSSRSARPGRGAFERICKPCRGSAWLHRRSGDRARYPPTINDPRAVELVRDLAGDEYRNCRPPTWGEDFSHVLQKVPGAMAFSASLRLAKMLPSSGAAA